ncbi:MAG: chromosome partitioning protein ParA [Flavobacteriaceae bacterium]|nr:chromosome partitioning protein ParA [Flavobacteriaceae bacterium]
MVDKEKKNSTGLKVALGLVILLLLGTAYYSFNLKNESEAVQTELMEDKQKALNDLENMIAKYEAANNENDITNEKLVAAKLRIQGLIDSLKVSDNSVKSLWKYKKKYLALQKEMDVLLAENDSLRVSNAALTTSLDSTQVKLEEGTELNNTLLKQNTALANMVENAAVLVTAGLKGFGVIERSSGKLIPTERAGRSDKIRVCYTVTKNTLVAAGDKEFFIQVIDPNENVLGLNKRIQFDGQILNYSLISKFNYQNRNIDICEFAATRGKNKFEKGKYRVNVYDKSKLVSSSEFTLR